MRRSGRMVSHAKMEKWQPLLYIIIWTRFCRRTAITLETRSPRLKIPVNKARLADGHSRSGTYTKVKRKQTFSHSITSNHTLYNQKKKSRWNEIV